MFSLQVTKGERAHGDAILEQLMFIYQKSHFLNLTADINCAATQSNMATDALAGGRLGLSAVPRRGIFR